MRGRMRGPRMSGEEMRAEAAARSRAGIERRRESILVSARPILHTAVAASLAWLAATELFGHSRPFFAPVAAVITLGPDARASAGGGRWRWPSAWPWGSSSPTCSSS